MDARWLVVGLIAMLCGFVNLGLMHCAAQRAVGVASSPRQMILVSLAANMLNLVVKSGGMAGMTMLISDGRRRGVSRGSVIAAYILVVTLAEIALALLLVVALATVLASGRLTATEGIAGGLFACYLAIRVAIFVVAWRSRVALRRMFAWPTRTWSRLRCRQAVEPSHASADDLFDALQIIRVAPTLALPTARHALVVDLIGVIELWAVCHAIGAGISLYVAFVGYVVSVLFTIVSVLPSGLGTVELSLGAVLVSFGVTTAAAIAVVVLYRLFELWLPLLVGSLATIRLRLQGNPWLDA